MNYQLLTWSLELVLGKLLSSPSASTEDSLFKEHATNPFGLNPENLQEREEVVWETVSLCKLVWSKWEEDEAIKLVFLVCNEWSIKLRFGKGFRSVEEAAAIAIARFLRVWNCNERESLREKESTRVVGNSCCSMFGLSPRRQLVSSSSLEVCLH